MNLNVIKGFRKRIIYLAFYGIVCTFSFHGVSAAPGGHEPDFSRAAERLSLDEAQTEQFVSVMSEQHEKRHALRESLKNSGDEKTIRAEMKPLREDTHEKLSAILSSEQLVAFEEMREKRRR